MGRNPQISGATVVEHAYVGGRQGRCDRCDGQNRRIADRFRRLPLTWQIFLPSAALLGLTAAILALTPAQVSSTVTLRQTIQVAMGLGAILLINLVLIRRTVEPIERLTRLMSEIDPLEPGQRAPVTGGSAETRQLASVFNEMLERLEAERRSSAVRMLTAQEEERAHIARELHDEVGQAITGLVLELDQAASEAPAPLRASLIEVRETARGISGHVRSVVRQLRPEALDVIGLRGAVITLADNFTAQASIPVERRIREELPDLTPEIELVVYRVAQESLTNIARHASASRVVVELDHDGHALHLRVSDDGAGIPNGSPVGGGIRGMRERALLVGGRLAIGRSAAGGTEVVLDLPLARSR